MEYSAEEKESIEIVEDKIWRLMDVACGNCIIEDEERNEYQNSIDTVINLLEKQRKEIEEKDKRIFYLENNARKVIEQEINNAKIDLYKNYIPKEAIRELFKKQGNYGSFLNGLRELLGE